MTVPLLSLLPFVLAVVLLAWVRPQIALLTPLVFHASYLLRSQVGLGALRLPTTLLEVLLWIAVVSAIGRALVNERVREAYQDAWRALPRRVLLCVVLFVVAATVSAAIAPHPRTAWGQWKAFVVEPIAYAAILLPLLSTPPGRRSVAGAILAGGLFSVSLSLLVGASVLVFPNSQLPTPYTLDFGRLRGIYDVPNSLALILAPLTVFAAVIAAIPRRSGGRLVCLARWSLLLFVPTLLLTQSFGGLLAAAGAALSTRFRTIPVQRRKVVLLGLLGALLLGLGLQGATGKFTHALASNSPVHARLQIWSVALALVRDHPILGTGLGTFEPAYQQKLHELFAQGSRERGVGEGDATRDVFRRLLPAPSYPHPPLEWVVRDPHNVVLSFWLQTGLLGLLSMGGLVLFSLRIWWTSCRSSPTAYCLLPTASVGALATLLLFGLVDVPYLKNDLSLLWWVFLISCVGKGEPARGTKIPYQPPRSVG